MTAFDVVMTLGGTHRTYQVILPAMEGSEDAAFDEARRRWEDEKLGSCDGVAFEIHEVPTRFFS